jgi:hypothetical protein
MKTKTKPAAAFIITSAHAQTTTPDNPMLRLYGPLEPWFDKTWRPGEIELVN